MSETEAAGVHILRLAYDEECEGCRTGDPEQSCTPRCTTEDVECPGVTPVCEMWMPCRCSHGPAIRDEELDEADRTGELHGEPHRVIDACWMTPTGKCFVVSADCLRDAVDDLGLQPGTYGVRHHMEDDTWFSLEVVTEPTLAEVTP